MFLFFLNVIYIALYKCYFSYSSYYIVQKGQELSFLSHFREVIRPATSGPRLQISHTFNIQQILIKAMKTLKNEP